MKWLVVMVLTSLILGYKIHQLNPLWLDLHKTSLVESMELDYEDYRVLQFGQNPDPSNPVTFQYRQEPSHLGVVDSVIKLPLKKQWQTEPLNQNIHRASKSSASVDQYGVIVPSDTSWLYSFDLDGELLWRFYAAEASRGFHGTAALSKDTVYIGAYNGKFYALDRETGQPRWAVQLGGAIGASPMLDGRWIYISVELVGPIDGFVVKLDRITGEVIWRTEMLGEQSHSTPSLGRNEKMIFVGANNSKLYGVDQKDGKISWQYKMRGDMKGTSAVHDGLVYISDWGHHLHARTTYGGEHKWWFDLGAKSQSSPTIIPDIGVIVISANNKRIYGLSLKEGKKLWQVGTDTSRMLASATAVKTQNGQWAVITTCGQKEVCVIEAVSGKVLQRLDVGGTVSSVPTVFDGKVYLTIDDNNLQVFSGQ